MKSGWRKEQLATLSTINYGYTESASAIPLGPRFLRITDIQNDSVDWDAVPYCPIDENKLSKFRLADGDIVFARTGATTGKSYLVQDPPEAVFASYLIRLRLQTTELLPEFVNLFFQTADYWLAIESGSIGSAQGGFNASKVGELSIPFPPLAEQQRIVAILDEAFHGIATAKSNADKNLQNARAIFESYLQSVFFNGDANWSDTVIGKCIRFIDYRGRTPEKTSSGLKLITAKNVRMGYLKESPEEFVAPESYDKWMTRGIPIYGDVLFTTEAPLANVAQLNTDEKVVFAQRIIVMQPDPAKLNSAFLKYMLLSAPIQQRIHEKGTGATVQGIKASLLKLIEISFPNSIAEQRQIVARLDALSEETQRLESIYQQKLAALAELKKSLLHQAFSGNL